MSSGSPLPNPTMPLTRQNWVLVDYENVQNIELDLVAGMPVHVILFIGQQQKSVPVALLTKVLAMKEQVIERLRKQTPASRPRKKRTLLSSVAAMFGKKLAAGEVESLVKQLIANGTVVVGQNDGVTYSL